ncbi:glutamic acid-rich protein, partial [Nematolebias whitei]|uniref:glutamic acid-rich protein n=1 Tax=Nematolebias whitei TaxID=451745 RepID=UPI00189762F6
MEASIPDRTEEREAKSEFKLVKQISDANEEKQDKDQLSAEETVQEKVMEIETPCREQSFRNTEEEGKDQQQEAATSEEASSCRGAAAKEAAADKTVETNAEDSVEKISTLETAKQEESAADGHEPQKSNQSGSEVNLPSPVPEDGEAAGNSDSQEIADTGEAAVKRKRSEEMEESGEETQAQQEVMDHSEEEHREEQRDKDRG